MKTPADEAAAAIRNQYAELGVAGYYRQHAATYENPHLTQVHRCLAWAAARHTPGKYLDLACGNGACTSWLLSQGHRAGTGCDPYFQPLYAARYGLPCYAESFEQLATQGLPERFDTVYCSYALHLCPASYFDQLLYQLASQAAHLLVISPSKYPLMPTTYFELADQTVLDRTHARLFRSKLE